MKVIGLVAVRMKSSRLKKKALLELNKTPLILNLLLRLKGSSKMDDIILCTSTNSDDKVLLDLASNNGFRSFAGSENDVFDRFLKAGDREDADIIVRITGDNPLTDPHVIDLMIDSHIENGADYTRMDNLPVGVTAEVISYSALKKAFELAEDSGFSEYMTYYFVDYPEIFKLNIMQPEENIKRPDYRLTIDYPEDYEVMKIIFDHFNDPGVPLTEVINFLDSNPDIIKINRLTSPPTVDPSINAKLKVNK